MLKKTISLVIILLLTTTVSISNANELKLCNGPKIFDIQPEKFSEVKNFQELSFNISDVKLDTINVFINHKKHNFKAERKENSYNISTEIVENINSNHVEIFAQKSNGCFTQEFFSVDIIKETKENEIKTINNKKPINTEKLNMIDDLFIKPINIEKEITREELIEILNDKIPNKKDKISKIIFNNNFNKIEIMKIILDINDISYKNINTSGLPFIDIESGMSDAKIASWFYKNNIYLGEFDEKNQVTYFKPNDKIKYYEVIEFINNIKEKNI